MDIPIRDLHRDQGMGLLSEVSFRLARPSVNVKSTIFPMDCCTVFGHSFVLVFFFFLFCLLSYLRITTNTQLYR